MKLFDWSDSATAEKYRFSTVGSISDSGNCYFLTEGQPLRLRVAQHMKKRAAQIVPPPQEAKAGKLTRLMAVDSLRSLASTECASAKAFCGRAQAQNDTSGINTLKPIICCEFAANTSPLPVKHSNVMTACAAGSTRVACPGGSREGERDRQTERDRKSVV